MPEAASGSQLNDTLTMTQYATSLLTHLIENNGHIYIPKETKFTTDSKTDEAEPSSHKLSSHSRCKSIDIKGEMDPHRRRTKNRIHGRNSTTHRRSSSMATGEDDVITGPPPPLLSQAPASDTQLNIDVNTIKNAALPPPLFSPKAARPPPSLFTPPQ